MRILQESDTWFTALHYSAQRGLVATVKSLIEHGADVNAVADNDILPLNIIASFNDSESHRQIKDILLNK
jgi:ankyrin repeat protein